MARRFQKVKELDSIVAPDGVESPEKQLIVIGSKWAGYVAEGRLTEIAPDASEDPLPADFSNGLVVESSVPAAQPAAVTAEVYGTGTGAQHTFTHVLATHPVSAASLVIKVNAVSVATTDVFGVIHGGSGATLVTGSVNPVTGSTTITFATAPVGGLTPDAITADYSAAPTLLTLTNPLPHNNPVVMKNGLPLTHAAGAGNFTIASPTQIALGTGANGTDRYTVAFYYPKTPIR